MHKTQKTFIAIVLLTVLALSGCKSKGREYLADISVTPEGSSAQIIIKEWRFLLGSGAEIYYKQGTELTLLGKTSGGDDGYCPFSEGNYTVAIEDNQLLVRWHFREDIWKESRFSLPDQYR